MDLSLQKKELVTLYIRRGEWRRKVASTIVRPKFTISLKPTQELCEATKIWRTYYMVCRILNVKQTNGRKSLVRLSITFKELRFPKNIYFYTN